MDIGLSLISTGDGAYLVSIKTEDSIPFVAEISEYIAERIINEADEVLRHNLTGFPLDNPHEI